MMDTINLNVVFERLMRPGHHIGDGHMIPDQLVSLVQTGTRQGLLCAGAWEPQRATHVRPVLVMGALHRSHDANERFNRFIEIGFAQRRDSVFLLEGQNGRYDLNASCSVDDALRGDFRQDGVLYGLGVLSEGIRLLREQYSEADKRPVVIETGGKKTIEMMPGYATEVTARACWKDWNSEVMFADQVDTVNEIRLARAEVRALAAKKNEMSLLPEDDATRITYRSDCCRALTAQMTPMVRRDMGFVDKVAEYVRRSPVALHVGAASVMAGVLLPALEERGIPYAALVPPDIRDIRLL